MNHTIRTYDVFEEDVTGDRYVNLKDMIRYLKASGVDNPAEKLKELYGVEGEELIIKVPYHPV